MSPVLYGKNAGWTFIFYAIMFWFLTAIGLFAAFGSYDTITEGFGCALPILIIGGGMGYFFFWRGKKIMDHYRGLSKMGIPDKVINRQAEQDAHAIDAMKIVSPQDKAILQTQVLSHYMEAEGANQITGKGKKATDTYSEEETIRIQDEKEAKEIQQSIKSIEQDPTIPEADKQWKTGLLSWNLPPKTKDCPYCAEVIKYEAIVCRYCGRDLPKKLSIAKGENERIVPKP